MKNISKILIANRGEIAVRIIKTCKKLAIETVVAVSDADRESLAAQIADQVICIGPAAPKDSYLKPEAIVTAALGTKADAIHPGYGFLSESPILSEICDKVDITFIGPSASCLRVMGNKLLAREIAMKAGVKSIPGSCKIVDPAHAVREAKRLGLPLMLKAAAGGGGRGMAIIRNIEELKTSFPVLSSEVAHLLGMGVCSWNATFPMQGILRYK